MMPCRSQQVVCVTRTALVLHIREVGDGEINYKGRDAYAMTLCGATVRRDVKERVADATCRKCLNLVSGSTERVRKPSEWA